MKKTQLIIVLVASCMFLSGQVKTIPVFIAGTEGYKSYRIPAIVSLPNGRLLAFAEGRVHGADDFGDINIVLKKSDDRGKTWTAIEKVVDAGVLQAGNPAPVVDLTDTLFPKGRVFLFYNTGNNHESEVRKGHGLREVWYKTSEDGGLTWSPAVNITLQVHRPNQPETDSGYHFPEDWRSYANTPGHAMQFEQGKYKGRIYVAANHSEGNPKKRAEDYFIHGYYTDDHGKTFHLGQTINQPGGNESMATELGNGKMMMNSRNQKGDIKARIVSVSSDGGQTWDTTYFDHVLIDPVNQASILTVGYNNGHAVVAFCNAADTTYRNNLTLRISLDDGKTWKKNYVIDNATDGSQNDHSAYSDMVKLAGEKIGILYECNGYSQIVFTVRNWK